jgi:hypothetical protein
LPCLMNIVMVIIFLTLIREDSIMFNLSHGNEEGAKIIIDKIYSNGDEVLQLLKSEVHVKPKTSGEKAEGIFSKNLWRSTMVGMVITILYQQSGVTAINIYSNRIINQINSSSES